MKELLIPVGDFLSLEYAITNKADAVYLGYKDFSARNYAKNFTKEELIDAIRLAHLYNVKVYVTVNTLIYDKEVDDFLQIIDFLHKNGVDAVIMQDFGMICLVRQMYPNLEIHVSTQANVIDEKAVQLYEKIGVKRVVLPREMSLEEITSIKTTLEKEVFIHGALCISYSGRCLMSSMLGSRSANQGMCSGCCRLYYYLKKNNKLLKEGYLLSTKELNTSPKIDELLKSDITSFKVEGRMKSPYYVGFITNFYKSLMTHENIDYNQKLDELKILFNRKFTLGHLFNDNILNKDTVNHIGLPIGKVISYNKNKIKIKLDYPIYQEDGIRFKNTNKGFILNYIYDSNNKLIKEAFKDDIIYVDNKINLNEYDIVYKTTSKHISDIKIDYNNVKIKIDCIIKAYKSTGFKLIFKDQDNIVEVSKDIIVDAIKSPISKTDIIKQISKLGNTSFIINNIDIDMEDNIFINIKDLNSIRRDAIKLLEEKRINKNNYLKKEVSFDIIDNFKDTNKVVNTYQIPQENVVANYTLNATNIYTVYYLLKYKYQKVILSAELNSDEVIYLYNSFIDTFKFKPPVDIIHDDMIEVMLIKGNILSIEKDVLDYTLIDMNNNSFNLLFDGVNTHIYYKKKNIIDDNLLIKE